MPLKPRKCFWTTDNKPKDPVAPLPLTAGAACRTQAKSMPNESPVILEKVDLRIRHRGRGRDREWDRELPVSLPFMSVLS